MLSFPICDEGAIFGNQVRSIAVVGTIHDHRYRWNPFAQENELTRADAPGKWLKWIRLSRTGGRNRDGVYNFRFVLNHNPRRLLKLVRWLNINGSPNNTPQDNVIAMLRETSTGEGLKNISIHVLQDCEACLIIDQNRKTLAIECTDSEAIIPLDHITTVELNGFIWDDLDMFNKFNERAPGREMVKISEEVWEKKVPLSTNGGIDFRADGVYQLLISVNGDEDQGYGALNTADRSDPNAIRLISGTGFGSSHGTSYHSAPTFRVLKDDIYAISVSLVDGTEQLYIRGTNGGSVELINNRAFDIQLLGDIHTSDSFDPTSAQCKMNALDACSEQFEKSMDLDVGTYSINFAIGGELFLDTMGLGCWLATTGTTIRGIGWHGKPNESNIGFRVNRRSKYRFTYDRATDIFTIEALDSELNHNEPLEAIHEIRTLSIVGNLPEPLVSWDTQAGENLMVSLGRGRFEKRICLESGVEYQFKLVGNQSNWQIVFADYELDGYGFSYDTNNPNPYDSRLEDLRVHGQLTTHGNPPPLKYVPSSSGLHVVMVDLWTGAYGIKAL